MYGLGDTLRKGFLSYVVGDLSRTARGLENRAAGPYNSTFRNTLASLT